MNESAKHIPPHRYQFGRRGNDTPRGGGQRNVTYGREGSGVPQQNRRGGKQQVPPTPNRPQYPQPSASQPQPRSTPPPTQVPEPRNQTSVAQEHEQDAPRYTLTTVEVENLLEQGVVTNIPIYKPKAATEAAKAGNSPWAEKPGHMASNKDFWLELRRQMSSLQKQQHSQQTSKQPPTRGG